MTYITEVERTITIPEETMKRLRALAQVLISYETQAEQFIKKMQLCNTHCKVYYEKQSMIEIMEQHTLIINDHIDAFVQLCGL